MFSRGIVSFNVIISQKLPIFIQFSMSSAVFDSVNNEGSGGFDIHLHVCIHWRLKYQAGASTSFFPRQP